ncbi:MAG: DUF1648 domain-containing protein [Gammaproteobacteria bacterium]|nr:MAG: DUF1648 domain-containing protein [Gammaproteobacteria bacterium]
MESRMKWLLGSAIAGIAFVVISAWSLPDPVASHFGGEGLANGFMSRGAYTALMAVLAGGIPLLLAGSMIAAIKLSGDKINLPNREYWLAPERRGETMTWLIRHTHRFALALLVFMCCVHWLVLRANALQPPRLEESWFIGGLLAFFLFLAGWFIRLLLRFRRAH